MSTGTRGPGRRTADTTARRFALRLFLLSLSVLFAAGLVGHLVIRLRVQTWPPAGSPGLPHGLWLSTAILFALSVVLVIAARSIRLGNRVWLERLLAAAAALGLAFIGCQAANWLRMAEAGAAPRSGLFAFTFYVLTFLHAVHVLGGLIPLVVTAGRAHRGRYTAGDHEGVELVSTYWHFLGVVWIVLFAVLSV